MKKGTKIFICMMVVVICIFVGIVIISHSMPENKTYDIEVMEVEHLLTGSSIERTLVLTINESFILQGFHYIPTGHIYLSVQECWVTGDILQFVSWEMVD